MKKILQTIFTPLMDAYNSLFTNDKGMSLRKVGFVFALLACYQQQLSILDDDVKKHVIAYWMIFAAVCIGLVTIPELIKFLNKTDTTPPTDGPKED